jgi:hypothetical protein
VTGLPASTGFADDASVIAVAETRLTAWLSAADALVSELASPPYDAVIGWLPVDKDDVENIALPPASVAVPSVVGPSRNVTVPVGVTPELATVAVKVTDWPSAAGLTEELRVVVVATGPAVAMVPLTVCVALINWLELSVALIV